MHNFSNSYVEGKMLFISLCLNRERETKKNLGLHNTHEIAVIPRDFP